MRRSPWCDWTRAPACEGPWGVRGCRCLWSCCAAGRASSSSSDAPNLQSSSAGWTICPAACRRWTQRPKHQHVAPGMTMCHPAVIKWTKQTHLSIHRTHVSRVCGCATHSISVNACRFSSLRIWLSYRSSSLSETRLSRFSTFLIRFCLRESVWRKT